MKVDSEAAVEDLQFKQDEDAGHRQREQSIFHTCVVANTNRHTDCCLGRRHREGSQAHQCILPTSSERQRAHLLPPTLSQIHRNDTTRS